MVVVGKGLDVGCGILVCGGEWLGLCFVVWGWGWWWR